MKIPSLTRLPNHQRFHFEPRYYDPVKEDIAERTSRIEQEIRQVSSLNGGSRRSLEGAFARRTRRTQSASILQFVIVAILCIVTFGYIYFGNAALYVLILAAPIYFLVRLRRFSHRS